MHLKRGGGGMVMDTTLRPLTVSCEHFIGHTSGSRQRILDPALIHSSIGRLHGRKGQRGLGTEGVVLNPARGSHGCIVHKPCPHERGGTGCNAGEVGGKGGVLVCLGK